MSKQTYSNEELQQIAKDTFEQFPAANKLFATSDGNCFLNENHAELHAGKDGKVFPFDREPAKPADGKSEEPKGLNAQDTIKAIKAVEKLEDLEPFKADTRASVIKALEDKTKQLTEAAAGDQNEQK